MAIIGCGSRTRACYFLEFAAMGLERNRCNGSGEFDRWFNLLLG